MLYVVYKVIHAVIPAPGVLVPHPVQRRMLKANYSGWLEAGSVLKKAKQFFNVTNFTLFIGDDNNFVIDLVPPP